MQNSRNFSSPTSNYVHTYHLFPRRECQTNWDFYYVLHPYISRKENKLGFLMGLPWWLCSKEPACQYRRCGLNPWVRRIPWIKKWQSTPVLLPGKFCGQRSPGATVHGVSKESDTNYRLNNNRFLSKFKGYSTRGTNCIPRFYYANVFLLYCK